MNCVIPYRHDNLHGEELRFAIRSLVKHFLPLQEIILVGDAPDWYNGPHIPLGDVEKRKEFSIYSKLMQVQGTVLYSNDDYFLTRDFTEDFPNYRLNAFANKMKNQDSEYRQLYKNCPPDWLFFDVHCPMVIDTSKFIWEVDRPIKTYYANQNNLQGTFITECKLRGNLDYTTILRHITGRPFFSTHGNIGVGGFPRLLNELYPEKSKYEI